MSTQQDNKAKALAGALAQIEKQFGKGTIMQMDGAAVKGVEAWSTRGLRLNQALGIGGVAKGRIIEIYGPESSGKTTICLEITAEVQSKGGTCAFIDAEHALDPLYAKNLGVDLDALLVSQPDNGEQALEIADMLTRSGAVDFIVVDSVAALTPQAELEGTMSDNSVGLQARMMGKAMRKLAGNLNRTGTTIMFTNQLREKVGVMFGSPETTPGGKALKFYASQRLDIRRTGSLKDGTDVVGNTVKVKIAKNKVAPPFKLAEFDILFGEGISLEGEMIDEGIAYELVKKSGSFFSYIGDPEAGEIRLGQGKENARKFLKDPANVEIREKLLGQLEEKMGIRDAVEAVEDDQIGSEEDFEASLAEEETAVA